MERFFCQKCLEATVSTSKPRLCCHCGNPFAAFIERKAQVQPQTAPPTQKNTKDAENTSASLESDEKRLSKLKMASHYRKGPKEDEGDNDEDDNEDDSGGNLGEDDSDFRGQGELSAARNPTENAGHGEIPTITGIMSSLLIKPRKAAVSFDELLKEGQKVNSSLEIPSNKVITDKKKSISNKSVRISSDKAKNTLPIVSKATENNVQKEPSAAARSSEAKTGVAGVSRGRGRPRKNKAV